MRIRDLKLTRFPVYVQYRTPMGGTLEAIIVAHTPVGGSPRLYPFLCSSKSGDAARKLCCLQPIKGSNQVLHWEYLESEPTETVNVHMVVPQSVEFVPVTLHVTQRGPHKCFCPNDNFRGWNPLGCQCGGR